LVKRLLVTTALEETWADGVPVLFLGEWCRRYDRREKWRHLDAETVSYHWDDRDKLRSDYKYLQELYEAILQEVAEQLNTAHGVEYSTRYWRILIGPWLGYFMQMLFDRWAMLNKALQDFEICGVKIVSCNRLDVIPNDMDHFHSLFVTDSWNEAIYGELLESMDVRIEKVCRSQVTGKSIQAGDEYQARFTSRVKRASAGVISALSGMFCLDREFFFISTYLPRKQGIALECKLRQVPKFWRLVSVPKSSANKQSSERSAEMPGGPLDFPSVVRVMLKRHIPTAYLEGYRKLVLATQQLPWPKHPKAIFTSNSYSADDVFKAWAAEKVENGAPLVIGQHGGNFGMARWSFNEEHQIAIADRFLTWGWSQSDNEKVVPVGNLKGFGAKPRFDRQGVALLVQTNIPRTSYHMFSSPVAGQWLGYFEDQCRFVDSLPPGIRECLLVRIYAQDYGWCQKQRWQDRFPNIRLDTGSRPMASLIGSARLYISTYNATTYLESMSLNMPTLMFWNPRHWELRDSAAAAIEQLKTVGIFHDTPESAARQLTKIWNDVDAWWEADETQNARRMFCERYARIPERPLKMMERIFRDVGRQVNQGTPAPA
jgi:putative transferase (TIGR04331 family)